MAEPFRVYLTRDIPQGGIDRLETVAETEIWKEDVPPPQDVLVEALADLDVHGLYCNVTDTIDADVMDASSGLRVIGTMSVGYDHIDLRAATRRDIAVGHTPGVLSETTADLAWALLMVGARRIVEANEFVREGRWQAWGPELLLGRDIHSSTIGIVGLGRIGTAMAIRTAGFDMDVRYSHPTRNRHAEKTLRSYGIDAEYCDLNALLEQSDFVSMHVPLTPDTAGMIGESELELMDENAVLVNTSRGEIVQTEALLKALQRGWIQHAVLDVAEPEPLPSSHPLMNFSPEKLTVTPHIGSASFETRSEMAVMTAENIIAGLRGEDLPYSVFDEVTINA